LLEPETISVALTNLKRQRLRSYLTLLGMIIGIAAIVALVSLGQGLDEAVQQQFEQIGLDIVYVEPGGGGFISTAIARTIEENDITIIKGIPGVEEVMGFYETVAVAKYKNKQASVFLIGYDPNKSHYLENTGFIELSRGRLLQPNDLHSIMITETFAKEAFPNKELKPRQRIEIDGMDFKIAGIVEDSDVAFGSLGMNNIFWTTKNTVRGLFGKTEPIELAVKVTDQHLVKGVVEKIEDRLERAHGEKDFWVTSTENLIKAFGTILRIIQLVLIGLASISVAVGGIGIMNTMLMSVTERTREIGTMKAIGATNRRVLSIFLAESALLGLVGGTIGIVLGYAIAFGISSIAAGFGFSLPISPDPLIITLGIAFSVLVGVVSGVMPARRAASMEPVVALRYE
jgi:putative ABC transport system permease protein